MTKIVRSIPLGEGKTKYIVYLQDEPSSTPTEVRNRRYGFLNEVVTDGWCQGLLNCGPSPFQKMSMWHDGIKWIIQLDNEE